MRIALTRERGRNDELRSWTRVHDIVDEVPLTHTAFFDDRDVLASLRSLDKFGSFASLVVTSARTARYAPLVRDALIDGFGVYSVGAPTTAALESFGVEVSGEAASRASDLALVVTRGPVLLLGATAMRDELANELESRGLALERVACYETVPNELSAVETELLASADVILIGAPSAWAVAKPYVERSTWVLVPGATTSDIVRRDHERVHEGWGPSLGQFLDTLET